MKKFWEKIQTSDIRNIISIIGVTGSFVMLYMLLIKQIPEGNKDIVLTAVGFVMGGLLSNIGSFYYGASKKDNDKPEKPE